MARRFVQSAVAVVLAALVIFGAAGIASAAFTSKSTASLTASTLTLQPPTVSRQTCESGFFEQVSGRHLHGEPLCRGDQSGGKDIRLQGGLPKRRSHGPVWNGISYIE